MKQLKKLTCGILFLFIAALMLPNMQSEAAAKAPTCKKSLTRYVIQTIDWTGQYIIAVQDGYGTIKDTRNQPGGEWENYVIKIQNLSSKAKITNIKSSNPKVMKAGYDKKYCKDGVYVSFRKFGTSKISFNVKQNGKTYKLSCKFSFKKRPAPFKTLKVNGKSAAGKYKGMQFYSMKTGKKSVKLSFAPTGMISNMSAYIMKDNGSRGKKLNNNSTVQIPAKGVTIQFEYTYKGLDTKDYSSIRLLR